MDQIEVLKRLKKVPELETSINLSLNRITYRISDFKRISGETNDYNRFVRALSSMSNGDALLLLNEKYDFGENDLIINKRITLYSNAKPFFYRSNSARYGAVIENGGIIFMENGITIKNVGVYCPTLDNGFECNQGSYHDILIEDCFSVARDHAFLFESYQGEVKNINIVNCYSTNSIHGFISKGFNVNFINCIAERHTYYGFGNISDNMSSSATQMALCYDNTVDGCHAYGCGTGFITYSRDKTNTTSLSRVINLKYINCSTNTCDTPMKIGENSVPSGYTSIRPIDSIIIDNFVSYYSTGASSIQLNNINEISLGQYIVDKPIIINKIVNIPLSVNKDAVIVKRFSDYESEIGISSSECNTFEIQARSDDSTLASKRIKINVDSSSVNNKLSIFIRSNQGNVTFGGFYGDCIPPANLTLTLSFGVGVLTEWIYYDSLGKYICTQVSSVKYA